MGYGLHQFESSIGNNDNLGDKIKRQALLIVLVILTEINVSFRNNMQQHLLSMACQ